MDQTPKYKSQKYNTLTKKMQSLIFLIMGKGQQKHKQ